MKMLVLGIKKFSGDVEGAHYDSTTVFVQMKQDESKGTAKGFAGQDLKYGDSSNFDNLSHLSFPIEAEVEIDFVSNGKGGMKNVITSLKPLVSPASASKA